MHIAYSPYSTHLDLVSIGKRNVLIHFREQDVNFVKMRLVDLLAKNLYLFKILLLLLQKVITFLSYLVYLTLFYPSLVAVKIVMHFNYIIISIIILLSLLLFINSYCSCIHLFFIPFVLLLYP